jgi:Ras-related protein Rab-2A
MNEINFDYLLKYIIIGDSFVGKSNILIQYTKNRFNEDYQSTIGVEFGAKTLEINNRIYKIQIWDTAGQENFRSITRAYYKNSVCAFVVYDITNRNSFANIQNWIEDCKLQCPQTITMVLIGNKSDIKDKRAVTYKEGNDWAINHDMIFFETSAKTGENINEAFEKSVRIVDQKIQENAYDFNDETCGIKSGINDNNLGLYNYEKKKKKEKCCK